MTQPMMKTCFVCKQSLPHGNFIRSRNRPDGRYPYCRKCEAEKRIAQKQRDPELAEKRRIAKKAYDLIYNDKHRERRNSETLANYHKNKEKKKAKVREWQIANPDLVRAYKQTTKAKRKSSFDGGISGAELLKWKNAQPKVCHWCDKKCEQGFHIDHYVPLSRGGLHEVKNLVISCKTCNLQKHAKDPLDFARQVGKLF